MIKCTQCGFENSLGRLYCANCKTRLDLGRITKEYFLNSEKHGAYLRKILLGIFLVIIFCFALALWPVRSDAVKISGPEFEKARNNLNKLQRGVAAIPIEFSEEEVSILFNYLIQEIRRNPDFKAGPVSIYAGQVIINPETLTIYLTYQVGPWMLDPVTIGPFWITYKVTGRPEKGPAGLRFAALNGAIGHLPLPVVGRNIGMTRLNLVFLQFKNARVFLSGLKIIAMKQGSITVFGAE